MQIDHGSRQPYYAQIVTGIEQDIAHGVLQSGEQLPSVREMARQHLLNPNTVSKAYKRLETQQIIETVPGKGTYVKVVFPEPDGPINTTVSPFSIVRLTSVRA